MNERIRQLSKQAGDYVNETYTGPVRSKTPGKIWEDGHIGWHTQFNQKFAQLIVAECAGLCNQAAEESARTFYTVTETKEVGPALVAKGSQVQAEKLSKQIREHFGVEE